MDTFEDSTIHTYFFEVKSCGPGGDNYVGYFLVIGTDLVNAVNKLLVNDNYKKAIVAHTPQINIIDPVRILDNFDQQVFELAYDCYN